MIPFNRPTLTGNEQAYMSDAMQRGHVSGDGHYTRLASRLLEEITGTGKALLTTSCSHALEMCAILLDLKPGDEVITPTFTFASVGNAIVARGAKPIFVDSRPDTLNLDEDAVEAAITTRTRAIVVMHYAGIACDMDRLADIGARYGIPIVEDNAHGLFGSYKERPLGSIGTFATQSFHETKNVICGEGGAILINDGTYVERAEIIREKGTNRSRFFRGQVDKYTWVEPGSSYLPSDLLAAFLCAQLESGAEIQRRRASIWNAYHAGLRSWAEEAGVQQPTVPKDRGQAYHLYYMLLPTAESRDALIAYLKEREIGAVFHYVPLHTSEYGEALGYRPGQFPIAESASARLVRLPLFNSMTEEQCAQVIEAVNAFRPVRS